MNNQIVSLFFILLLSSFSCSAPASNNEKRQINADAVNDLPSMTITFLDGSTLNIKELEGKTILIFFQPDCDHCQREARDIQQNLAAFRNNTLYFITASSLPAIEKFALDYKLFGHPNVFFAFTSAENILNSIGPVSAPSLYIYSTEHKLIKAFNGEVEIEKVLKYI